MFGARFWFLLLIMANAAAMRVIDHPWNLAPVGAIALFAGAHFRDRVWAFVVPLVVMFFSDVALGYVRQDWSYGFHTLMPVIYACYVLYVALGIGIQSYWDRRRNHAVTPTKFGPNDASEARQGLPFVERYLPVVSATLAGAVVFFLVSNFGVWAFFTTYAKSWSGLMECYVAALPYFRATLASDVIYAVVLFGGYDFLRGQLPFLEETATLRTESTETL